jgi:hypothetical protein
MANRSPHELYASITHTEASMSYDLEPKLHSVLGAVKFLKFLKPPLFNIHLFALLNTERQVASLAFGSRWLSYYQEVYSLID